MKSFRIVYWVLTLNFFFPALYYIIDAGHSASLFYSLGIPFGVTDVPFTEESMFWRVLGIGNVATLGFCCALMLYDLKRFWPVLVPLVFLKGCSVVGFAMAFLSLHHPSFAIGVVFDGVTMAAMIYFARKGYNELLSQEATS